MITSNGFRSNHEHLFYGILSVLEQELSDKHDDIELMEAANGIIDAYSGKVSKAISIFLYKFKCSFKLG